MIIFTLKEAFQSGVELQRLRQGFHSGLSAQIVEEQIDSVGPCRFVEHAGEIRHSLGGKFQLFLQLQDVAVVGGRSCVI